MSSQIQKQISQLQSKLAKTRSNTPRRESMNSKQRRKSKSPAHKKGLRPQDRAILKYKQVEDHDDQYKSHGGAKLNYQRARDCLTNKMPTAQQMVDRIKASHRQAESLKLPVWDHTKRVITDDGKTRFQTFAEWKASQPKPSLLTEALKESKCKHEWANYKMNAAKTAMTSTLTQHCLNCGIDRSDSKSDGKDDIIADTYKQLYESVCQEFEMARETMRAGLKDKPIRMRLSTGFVLTTTVTTGVTNTVNINGTSSAALDPSQCTEWSTLAALFDEYKVMGGECVFNYTNPINGLPSASQTTNGLPVMAYETDNVTSAASSSLSLTQLSQHRIYEPLYQIGPGTGIGGPASGCTHRFPWHTSGGIVIGGTIGANPGREWIVIPGVGASGQILFYHVGSVITAINTGAGLIYFDLEFRCRT